MDVLAFFAGFKRRGDRLLQDVGDPVSSDMLEKMRIKLTSLTKQMRKSSRRRRRRTKSSRRNMTDEELEAELELRRARRARERDAYKKGLEGKKLNALENELSKLKSELSTFTGKPTGASVRFSDNEVSR